MSLNAPAPVRTFRVGIIAAKNLDDPQFLPDLVGENLGAIEHLYTNGANALVTDFARENGIPCTVFPIAGGRGLPWSTSRVIFHSEFVYIIATPESKSTPQVAGACEAKGTKYKVVPYEPLARWKQSVEKTREIISAMSKDELAASPYAQAILQAL